jgi:hypothetical protein
MSKITVYGFGGNEIEIDEDRILCNHVIFPWEFNPHHVCLWVINNRYGYLGAVWASYEQDAFDTLVNENLGDGLLIDAVRDGMEDKISYLGNAGEPADLSFAGIQKVCFIPERDYKLLCMFAEARGNACSTLGDL